MKKKIITSLILCMILTFAVSNVCFAVSIKTKVFFKDIQRCNKFIDNQYDVLMAFLTSLTDEDIEAINSQKPYKAVEIFNSTTIDTFKKLEKMTSYYPKKVKHSSNSTEGLPRNFLAANFLRVTNYKGILKNYDIPEEDFAEALSKYSEYSIGLLDKLQELRAKVQDSGLKIYLLPKLNNISIGVIDSPIFLVDSDIINPTRDSIYNVYSRIYNTGWISSVKDMPELYSNKIVLTATKLWLEFLLNNDLTSNKSGDSYDEKIMTELEKIEKRLAKVSGNEEKKKEASINAVETKPVKPSVSTSQQDTFKLELPE